MSESYTCHVTETVQKLFGNDDDHPSVEQYLAEDNFFISGDVLFRVQPDR